ncbi:AAA family ATPase [Burkholderia vietnamiensis]|uniref:AAA family ATPase n=1 Tax=Burkholderia vietnamiensis TaxID=60552 RepID=UPI001CF579EA|nr:ATP-binding protein [Burkholderia vietnamiensis]MCA8287303.1 ATP-binding protein [Burkholderia vietnamiensis]
MIPGGIADKLGNRYEAKWLALKLIDVVLGHASMLCFEGTAEAFSGFEFLLMKGAEKQWHQVKISNTSGNWTTNRLQKLGVLDAFRKRLSLEDPADQCHFVSQDPAVILRDLSERARTAIDYADFQHLLSKELSEAFQEITTAWGTSQETAYSWLKRIHCRVQPEGGLDESIEAFGGLCIDLPSTQIFAALRDYMEQRFNRQLTTDVVRDELPRTGVDLVHWQLDRTLTERLRSSTEDYLFSYPSIEPDSVVPRREVGTLIEELTNPEGASVVLLTGGAGSGKSATVSQLVAELRSRGIVHVALRADEFLEVATKEDIGKVLTQRRESPVVTLKGVSETALSVLLIDQVDAVSEISGRSTRVKTQLLRMLSDAEKLGTVKVVCVCRAFDLENDARLKALASKAAVRRIEVAPLDWLTEIKPLLEQRGIDVDALSSGQRKLLEVPLNLGLFLEVYDDGAPFSSRNDLFSRLLEKKTRSIAARDPSPTWQVAEPLNAIAKWMSDRQTLQAPLATLQSFDSVVDILSSENLITVRNGKVHLFHESFFDYLFARGFATSQQTLVALLLSDDDQYLFRRTQVRQILESLREDDRRRYLSELENVLTDERVRYHIKLAVSQWLGALQAPSPEELAIVLKLDPAGVLISPLIRSAVYGTPAWFDLALATGSLVERELNSAVESRREAALFWLSRVAPQRPDEVGRLLDNWYRAADSERRTARLLDWFSLTHGQPIGGQLLSLCEALVRAHPHALMEKTNHLRMTTLMEALARNGLDAVSPIADAYFSEWFKTHPEGQPFLRDESGLDLEPLEQLATQNPKAYLAATTRALVLTFERIVQAREQGKDDWTFSYRRVGEQYSVGDKFLTTYRETLKSLATHEPTIAEAFLSQLTSSMHAALLQLHLEAIAANGAALAHRLPPLLGERRLFRAGWSDTPYRSFADAARAALPHLPVESRSRIEAKVFAYRPELDFARNTLAEVLKNGEDGGYRSMATVLASLRESGHTEWCIWETLGEDNVSVEARARLAELRRKFAGRKARSPQGIRAGFVSSPISLHAVALMSNRHWLQAIKEHADKDRRMERRPLEGGSEQLAMHLVKLAQENPLRFASLLTQIPEEAPASYVRNILLGLGEASTNGADTALILAILSAHQRVGRPFGTEISHVISRHPAVAADDGVFDALCWYVEFGAYQERGSDALTQGATRPYSIEQLLSRGDNIYTRALGSPRGSAANALARVLWRLEPRRNQAWDLLKRRVHKEPELPVRCVLAETLIPLLVEKKSMCAELVEVLATHKECDDDGNLLVLTSRVGLRLHSLILYRETEIGDRLIECLLASKDEVLRAIGAWQVIGASFYEDRYVGAADKLIASSEEFKQLAAECAISALVEGGLTKRALTCIPQYFNDPNKQVRARAGEVFRNIPPDNFEGARHLCRQYIDSVAFDDQAASLFYALGRATCDVTDIVISAAEKLVRAVAHSSEPHRRASDLHQLQELLKNEYSATEHAPQLRKRILDVLDVMLEHEMYGVHEVLKAHERD